MLATQRGHKDIVKVLLERNINLHITNKVGLCLVVISIYYHMELLTCIQSDGRTALHFAAAKGNVEIFRMLAGGGADVEVKDKVRSSWIAELS